MITVNQIISEIDNFAPFASAEAWDHCGLRLGDPDAQINGIAVSLDASEIALSLATQHSCNLLVTHHPLLFNSVENLICSSLDVKIARAAFKADINVLSCHTNWDIAFNGVNHTLARVAGLNNILPLVKSPHPGVFGMGAMGELSTPMSVSEVCALLAHKWKLTGYRLLGSNELVSKVALCGGAGGGLWREALACGSQLYVTADLNYHSCLQALEAGLSLMICDHGEMEDFTMSFFADCLREVLSLPVFYISQKQILTHVNLWCLTQNV